MLDFQRTAPSSRGIFYFGYIAGRLYAVSYFQKNIFGNFYPTDLL